MSAANTEPKLLNGRMALTVLLGVLVLGMAACLPAGRLDLPWVWLFVLSYGLSTIALVLIVDDRALFAERRQPGAGVKRWDWWLSRVPGLFMVVILVVAGFDVRFGWSPPVSPAARAVSWVVLILCFALTTWAMRSNTFFAAVVRIQTERDHRVVSAGPYAYVRHPGYLSMAVMNLALPVMLGSLWALLPGAAAAALIALRTALEDHTLQAELPGYLKYAGRVRYRLLPGVW